MLHNSSTEICGLDRFQCAEDAKENFYTHRDEIECLDPCNKVSYEVKNVVDESILVEHYSGLKKGLGLLGHPIDFDVKFDKNFFFAFRRRKNFSDADILGLVGGFLGLFAGVSVLSLFEIIFHVFKTQIKEENSDKSEKQNIGKEFLAESSIHGLGYVVNNTKFIR
jgi:hypothetical protein